MIRWFIGYSYKHRKYLKRYISNILLNTKCAPQIACTFISWVGTLIMGHKLKMQLFFVYNVNFIYLLFIECLSDDKSWKYEYCFKYSLCFEKV